jgi:hypothetical protein
MSAGTSLLSSEQAEAICPGCLGTGSRADELKLPAGAPAHAALAREPCDTCEGFGSLAARPRLRRFARIDAV